MPIKITKRLSKVQGLIILEKFENTPAPTEKKSVDAGQRKSFKAYGVMVKNERNA